MQVRLLHKRDQTTECLVFAIPSGPEKFILDSTDFFADNISMEYPKMEDVQRDLAGLWRLLPGILDKGVAYALREHEQEQEEFGTTEVDGWWITHQVRHRVKLELQYLGYHAEDIDVEIRKVANTGLLLHCRGYSIKILRPGIESLIPQPQSPQARAFFDQVPLPLPWDEGPALDAGNLYVVWETYSNYSLRKISVACPGEKEPRWQFELEYPAAQALPQPEILESAEESLDIPMYVIDEDKADEQRPD